MQSLYLDTFSGWIWWWNLHLHLVLKIILVIWMLDVHPSSLLHGHFSSIYKVTNTFFVWAVRAHVPGASNHLGQLPFKTTVFVRASTSQNVGRFYPMSLSCMKCVYTWPAVTEIAHWHCRILITFWALRWSRKCGGWLCTCLLRILSRADWGDVLALCLACL